MSYKLRPYQEHAVTVALEAYNNKGVFRYEAFDMGLGKTLIMLDFLKRSGASALVLAPMFPAIRTWPQEIEKFVPEFSYVVLHGKDKNELFKSNARVKILNYDGLVWFNKMVKEYGPGSLKNRVLILDEATAIKNPSTKRFKALKALRGYFENTGILCLSGEPLPNGYMDLWAQYWMLDRGKALGESYSAFRRRYFFESGPPMWKTYILRGSAEEIRQRVSHMTSVLRAEDHISMPESTFIDVPVELPKAVMQQYNQLKREAILNYGQEAEKIITADTAGVKTSRLRQITQGAIYNSSEDDAPGRKRAYTFFHSAKVDALAALVEAADGSPILCPISFSFEVDLICKGLGYEVPCIDGKTPKQERMKILDKWDKREIPLLLCQPLSLSYGLNMQRGGSIIVWYGRPWSLEHYNQLNGRLIRPGQTSSVRVYFITAKGTIDERVAAVLASKASTQEEFKNAIVQGLLE